MVRRLLLFRIINLAVVAFIFARLEMSEAQNPGTGEFSFVQHQTFRSDRLRSYFGMGIAISDDEATLAISAPFYDPAAPTDYPNGLGGVFVYQKQQDGTYSQYGGRLYGSGASVSAPWQGYTFAMSSDASTLAWGGYSDHGIWVFVKSGSSYVQQARLTPSYTGGSYTAGGFPLDLSSNGDVMIAGTPSDSSDVGAFLIYRRSGGSWSQELRLAGDSSQLYPRYGTSVAINEDGTIVAVGGNSNYVHIYAKIGSSWIQQSPKVPCTSSSFCNYGTNALMGASACLDLSADGNWLIAGQGTANQNKNYFDYILWKRDTSDSNLWVVVHQGLVSSTLTNPAYFGTGCSMSRDGTKFALAGGYNYDYGNAGNVAAYVFDIINQSVVQQYPDPLLPSPLDNGGLVPNAAVALSSDGSKVLLAEAKAPCTTGDILCGAVSYYRYEEHTFSPSKIPSQSPSTSHPSTNPTTSRPSVSPTTSRPSKSPSKSPSTSRPSKSPSISGPTTSPITSRPSSAPSSSRPSANPTTSQPSQMPSISRPSQSPTASHPTSSPTTSRPSRAPITSQPSHAPSRSPTRGAVSGDSTILVTAIIASASAAGTLVLLSVGMWLYGRRSKTLITHSANELVDHRTVGRMEAFKPKVDV